MIGIWSLEYYRDRRGRNRIAVVSTTGETIATFRASEFDTAWSMVDWRNAAATYADAPQRAAA